MRNNITQVLSNIQIQDDIWLIQVEEETKDVKPGQFYMLSSDKMPDFPLLPRPLSVCQAENRSLTFCYFVCGKGTEKLAGLREGNKLRLIGPLGNGFDMDEINSQRKVAIVSGGIGIAPFVELSRRLTCGAVSFCGFSDSGYLTEYLPNVSIATENGSVGYRGLVTDLLRPKEFDMVLACGPEGFSQSIVRMCRDAGAALRISLDKHMACGVGACLVCVCQTKYGYRRCCCDGPVFKGEELLY